MLKLWLMHFRRRGLSEAIIPLFSYPERSLTVWALLRPATAIFLMHVCVNPWIRPGKRVRILAASVANIPLLPDPNLAHFLPSVPSSPFCLSLRGSALLSFLSPTWWLTCHPAWETHCYWWKGAGVRSCTCQSIFCDRCWLLYSCHCHCNRWPNIMLIAAISRIFVWNRRLPRHCWWLLISSGWSGPPYIPYFAAS